MTSLKVSAVLAFEDTLQHPDLSADMATAAIHLANQYHRYVYA